VVLHSIQIDGCELEYVDGERVRVDPVGETVTDSNGTRVLLGELLEHLLSKRADWQDNSPIVLTVNEAETRPAIHETASGPRPVRTMTVRAHRAAIDMLEQLIQDPSDWVFLKVLPGEVVREVHFVELRELDRIAEADVAFRKAIEGASCPVHGTKAGVVVTWRGIKSAEVRLDPVPCCDKLDDLVFNALKEVLGVLEPKWLEQDLAPLRKAVGAAMAAFEERARVKA
jgi:hypothetical protein